LHAAKQHLQREGNVASRSPILLAAALLALAAPHAASAQTKGGPTPAPQGAAVYFVEIKDGATLPTRPTIHFGLRNMGVAPAGLDRPNAGHHHLLIDVPTPPLDQPIPNDFNHLHFGAGQTEAEVTLTPGKHTLQLILGDKDHVPHTPPIMSERITVTVVDAPAGAVVRQRHPSPPGAEVYFANIRDGQYIPARMVVRFGLLNMGIAPAGVTRADTGHHHLLVDTPLPPLDRPIPNDFNHLHFGVGQTEAAVTLAPGKHTLQLVLGDDNHLPHEPPVVSKPISVIVANPEERPLLRRGAQGAQVEALQALLGITVDGNFGPETEEAVIAAQRQASLAADGVVGRVTWGMLDEMGNTLGR
jgi:peptidoglycan hydrolase-like protein with peptidoglycan-binding domain